VLGGVHTQLAGDYRHMAGALRCGARTFVTIDGAPLKEDPARVGPLSRSTDSMTAMI
jgi:hypothetical protein